MNGKTLMEVLYVEIVLAFKFNCIHTAVHSKSPYFFLFASLLASVLLDLAEALISKWPTAATSQGTGDLEAEKGEKLGGLSR